MGEYLAISEPVDLRSLRWIRSVSDFTHEVRIDRENNPQQGALRPRLLKACKD